MAKNSEQELLFPQYSEDFFNDYAGRIISDPKVAIIELVANSWDAGAKTVELKWPIHPNAHFEIIDDGIGMSQSDFKKRWTEFSYNRLKHQGAKVTIPDIAENIQRKVHGKNGKGRHSLFCFSNKYRVETWKDGVKSIFEVTRGNGDYPYTINFVEKISQSGHGTKISCEFNDSPLDVDDVKDLVGSKFIADSFFEIHINDDKIDPFEILGKSAKYECVMPDKKKVEIFVIDSKEVGRTSKQHGVAWWVNNRLVGEHSWKGFDGVYLDARHTEARRYTIIVKADILENYVKADWTGFKDEDAANDIRKIILERIYEIIGSVMYGIRRDKKISALSRHKADLELMDQISRSEIGSFVDNVQSKCPTLRQPDLDNIAEILVKMEVTRTGHRLLKQISQLSADDMDSLTDILDEWDIMDAKHVLSELKWRLDLINNIESLVENPNTNELRELQPLFERGLWIFGPEFESVNFTSNRSLATVMKTFFDKSNIETLENPQKRPDFVVLPDSSIGAYSSDRYNEDTSEVEGLSKILIIELKKGDSIIRIGERRQVEDYASAIMHSGKTDRNTMITCFVLGSRIHEQCSEMTLGDNRNIKVIPKPYSTVLRQAHARTFNLMNKIKQFKHIGESTDDEIEDIIKQKEIPYFD